MKDTTKGRRRFIAIFFVSAVVLIAVVVSLITYNLFLKNADPETSTSSIPAATSTPTPSSSSVPLPNTGTDADSIGTNTGYTVGQIKDILDNTKVVTTIDNEGYVRNAFGNGWLDTDNNGCDTRNDILLRDLVDVTIDSDGCRVLSGTLIDSYTGKAIDFIRGKTTSTAVQIDHLVPLSLAWAMGASDWNEATREAFANDPSNLFGVDGAANNNKSDQSFSDWTPAIYSCISNKKDAGESNKDAKNYCLGTDVYNGEYYMTFDCEYAARYVLVISKYALAITENDSDRINKALATCR